MAAVLEDCGHSFRQALHDIPQQLTLPGGKSEGGRIIGSTLLLRTGTYQAGAEASVSVTAVYELPDGSNISSAAETLTCTVA